MNDIAMHRAVVATIGDRQVIAMDTIAHVGPEDADHIVTTGSHGGISSGEYAGRVKLAAVFFNDAGIGKDDAGIAALPYLDARGIACGTVTHVSAEIGNGHETWSCGVISTLNDKAEAAGFVIGEPLEPALRRVFGGEGR